MSYQLVVNGLSYAFLKEVGCPCVRCRQLHRRANTSVSIIEIENGETFWHALIDVGLGVVDSLYEIMPPEKFRLDWLLLTHWHPDHMLELNRLCESWRRTTRRREPDEGFKPIPLWCRAGSARWLERYHPYEWNVFLNPHIDRETHPPGIKLPPVPMERSDLKITPVTVAHSGADIHPLEPETYLPCCASFVIETATTKTVLLWDIDNTNEWLCHPNQSSEEAISLLSKPDYLFIDCNSWQVEEIKGKNIGHTSFSTVQQYAQTVQPKETLLVHLSGHEDGIDQPGWGWDDYRWTREAQKVWSLPGTVRVPEIGEIFFL